MSLTLTLTLTLIGRQPFSGAAFRLVGRRVGSGGAVVAGGSGEASGPSGRLAGSRDALGWGLSHSWARAGGVKRLVTEEEEVCFLAGKEV